MITLAVSLDFFNRATRVFSNEFSQAELDKTILLNLNRNI